MSGTCLSKAALEKVWVGFHVSRAMKWNRPVPMISYYRRLHSIMNDGRVKEHGDGIHLSLVAVDHPDLQSSFVITIGESNVYCRPDDYFRSEPRFIDCVNDRLVLTDGWPTE